METKIETKPIEIRFVRLNDNEMFINRASLIALLQNDENACLRGNETVTANYIKNLINRLEKFQEG